MPIATIKVKTNKQKEDLIKYATQNNMEITFDDKKPLKISKQQFLADFELVMIEGKEGKTKEIKHFYNEL